MKRGWEHTSVSGSIPSSVFDIEGYARSIQGSGPEAAKRAEVGMIAARLREWGLKGDLAPRIFRRYGRSALEAIQKEPYRLVTEVRGIDFRNADRIARKMGIAPTAPERLAGGVLYTLSHSASEGYICLPYHRLLALSGQVLRASPKLLSPVVESLAAEKLLVIDDLPHGGGANVYLADLYRILGRLVQSLKRLVNSDPIVRFNDIDGSMESLARRLGLSLTSDQREAIKMAALNRITFIDGRKGVGKTTAALALARLFADEGLRVLMVFPARRDADSGWLSGISSKPLIDLLKFDESRREYEASPERRLEADLLILDGAAEVGITILDALLGALPLTASLVLVGDLGCARPLEGGGFWESLATSEAVDRVELKNQPRGERPSLMALNASRLSQGQYLYFKSRAFKEDFRFLERTGSTELLNTIEDLVANRIPDDYGYDPTSDIQVITPAMSGPLGEADLNRTLQKILNPDGERITGSDLRVGDRVIQQIDNPARRVMAGEVGKVERADPRYGKIRVSFDGYLIDYDPDEIDELTLSYAAYPRRLLLGCSRAVIVLLDPDRKSYLNRNLLYRALAKATELAVVVGSRKALSVAIKRSGAREASSPLLHRFKEPGGASLASPRGRDAYLDVEAARNGRIVVIGIHIPGRGTVQLVGQDITPEALLKSLSGVKTIYTYNGDRFDLPLIREELGVDLRSDYATHDLVHDCHNRGLYGGLKKVEETMGIGRKTEGLKGDDAVKLWSRYQSADDKSSYKLLLLYNIEDVENLKLLKERLGVGGRKSERERRRVGEWEKGRS